MSHTVLPSKAGIRASTVLIIGLVMTTLGPVAPASAAAPASPTGLNVAQPLPSTTKFNWNRSAGAEKYEIQVDNDLAFGSPEVNASTVNSVYVPEVTLKTVTNYWRVRAVLGSDRSDWTTGLPFDPPQVTVPIPSSPVDGAHLQQPDNAPLLTWTRSPGAKSYTIQVDSDSDFVGADEFTTETTSLVVSKPLGLGDWFWRVIATKGPGIVSQPSDYASFWIDALATPDITGPLGPQPNISPDVIDVVLDWAPVAGAIGYELQVASNSDFTAGSLLEDRTGSSNRVFGTRFSPAVTYDNNGYYWRVRAVDTAGNSSGWAQSQVDFNRHYDITPDPVFPNDGAQDVPDPLYFQWEPVTNASEYEIWVGTDENFSPDTYNSCRVAATTYTPGLFAINDTDLVNVLPNRINEDCDPRPGVTNYWRVRPLDRPYVKPGGGDLPGVQGLWSPTQSFKYTGLAMNNLTPADGATVSVPTLRWDTTPGALTYTVVIKLGGSQVDTATTHATSYTPKGQTRLAAGTYTWSVYAETAEGTRSLAPLRTFTIAGTPPTTGAAPLTPLSPSPTGLFNGAPSLTWEPEPSAAYYRVHATKPGGNVLISTGLFETPMAFPAMTDISSELKRPGTYTWWVTAHTTTGVLIATGPSNTFEIRQFTPADGHEVALGGRALDVNNPGQTPCTPTTGVCTVPATPVLKWDRAPGTAFYIVYVSEDPSFSNLLEPTTALPSTTNTIYMPALDNRDWSYADNQTERPYYWFVRPCRAVGQCGAGPVGVAGSAQHTFFKKSPPVTGLQSTLTQKTEVTFTWDNYYRDPASTNPGDKWGQTGEPLPQSAMKYRIEVATDSSFSPSAVIESAEIDQTTFTSTAKIYANRTYWWRVQAIDSDSNGLTWSTQEATFLRETPAVPLVSPASDATVPGTTAFRWQAQPYAKAYDIEVYKNDDPSFSTANKVASGTNLLTTAYTWSKSLAPSAAAYRWRVRRIDASGSAGAWSPGGRFFVADGIPNITSPANGAIQGPDGPVLEWEPLDGAASYTVTVVPTGGGSAVIANTVSAAWAATAKFATGTYTWTLAAKDASGNTLGTSVSTFTVNAVLVADRQPVILSPDGTGVGRTLGLEPPTWVGHTDVTMSYQWLRDGQPIIGASTGTTYVIQAADFGKTISVKATGSKANYASGTTTSAGVLVSAGDALVATSNPILSGSATVGNALTTTVGTWNPAPTAYRYQWLRNSTPIDGGTLSAYRTTAADVGTQISVRVFASKQAYADGEAVSAPLSIVAVPGAIPGGPLTSTTVPVITGTPNVGSTLVTNQGSWSAPPTSIQYQWLRNGVPVAGATAGTYRLTLADAATSLSVQVVASKATYTDGMGTSAAVPIPKVKSTVSAFASPAMLKTSQRSKLTISVYASPVVGPTGKIRIKDGAKTLKVLGLTASKNGKITFKLPRLKAGKHKIKITFGGTAQIASSTAKTIKLVVKR